MDRNETKEKVFELVFGVIAIVAAIGEAIANGLNASSILGAIKDVSGTLIIVVLFVMFVRQIPRKPKNIIELLEREVESWGIANAPMIFKAEGYKSAQGSPYKQGFLLLQDPRKFVSLSNLTPESSEWSKYAKYGNGNRTGKFIDLLDYKKMTEDIPTVSIIMKQSHFSQMNQIDEIIRDIYEAINAKYGEVVTANRQGSSYEILLTFKKKIETENDVKQFVEVLDYVLSLVKVVA